MLIEYIIVVIPYPDSHLTYFLGCRLILLILLEDVFVIAKGLKVLLKILDRLIGVTFVLCHECKINN